MESELGIEFYNVENILYLSADEEFNTIIICLLNISNRLFTQLNCFGIIGSARTEALNGTLLPLTLNPLGIYFQWQSITQTHDSDNIIIFSELSFTILWKRSLPL